MQVLLIKFVYNFKSNWHISNAVGKHSHKLSNKQSVENFHLNRTPATCTMGLVFCLLWIGTLNAVSVDPCLNYREVEAVEVVHPREGLLGALVNLEGEDFEMHGVMKVMIW